LKTYLALGDSYTIGEQVEIIYNFPYQLIQLLRAAGQDYSAPEIIAKTGWTSDELLTNLSGYQLQDKYDLVSLLIGVNNQYRGRSAEEFEKELKTLVEKGIACSKNREKVFVISIPDWGVTPFAEGRDRARVAKEIDSFNQVCQKVSEEYQIRFIEITGSQRADGNDPAFLAPDGLHPGRSEYKKWAEKIFEGMMKLDKEV